LNLAFTENSSIKAIQQLSQHQNPNRPKQHLSQNHKAEELNFSSVVWREDDLYVAWCSDLDIASQGKTIEESLKT